MPDMNGIALIRLIRERYGDIPIILMTAYGNKSLVVEALRNRCDNYIDKPFKPSDLVAQIDEIQLQREKRMRRGIPAKQAKPADAGPGELIWLEPKAPPAPEKAATENREPKEAETPTRPKKVGKQQKIRRTVRLKRSTVETTAKAGPVTEKGPEKELEQTSGAVETVARVENAVETVNQGEMEKAEAQDLVVLTPLEQIGMGYTVPLVKIVFPLGLFLFVTLTCLYLLILPFFK